MPASVPRLLRRLSILLAGTLAAAVLTIGVGMAPANAGLFSARDACQANVSFGPDLFTSVSQHIAPTTSLSLLSLPDLEPGDFIRVTATGSLDTGGWFSHTLGPDGNGWLSGDSGWPGFSSDPSENSNEYALYGYFGRNGFTFRAGSDSGCQPYTTAFGNGLDTIWRGVNDWKLDDNTGPGFDVRIRVFRNPSELRDGGFEQQPSSTISPPWAGEGPSFKGIDIARNLARTGLNNAFIRTSSTNWNALTQRVDNVTPNTHYRLQGWVRTSANFSNLGFFGVRPGISSAPMAELRYGAFNLGGYQQLTVDFNTGSNTTLTVFVGYWGPGYDSWIQIDDLALWPTEA